MARYTCRGYCASSNGGGGACVEVAYLPGVIGVRDTKNRSRGVLTLSSDAWVALVTELKAG
nr:DUF397 domain-containing protein [Amycolatopsis cihanbeyliensis]